MSNNGNDKESSSLVPTKATKEPFSISDFRKLMTDDLVRYVCESTGVKPAVSRLMLVLAFPGANSLRLMEKCDLADIPPGTYYGMKERNKVVINKFLREEADNIFAAALPDVARKVTDCAIDGDPKMARLVLEREMGINRGLGDKEGGRPIQVNVAISHRIGLNMGVEAAEVVETEVLGDGKDE